MSCLTGTMHCVARVRACTVKIRAGIHTPRRHRSTNAGKRDGRASRTSGPAPRICLHSTAPSSSRRRCRRCRRVGMLGMSQSAVRTPVRRSRRIDRAEYDTKATATSERARVRAQRNSPAAPGICTRANTIPQTGSIPRHIPGSWPAHGAL